MYLARHIHESGALHSCIWRAKFHQRVSAALRAFTDTPAAVAIFFSPVSWSLVVRLKRSTSKSQFAFEFYKHFENSVQFVHTFIATAYKSLQVRHSKEHTMILHETTDYWCMVSVGGKPARMLLPLSHTLEISDIHMQFYPRIVPLKNVREFFCYFCTSDAHCSL